jgi:hypothetical protein
MRIYLVHTHTKRDATASGSSGRTRAIFLSYLNALFRMRIRVNVAIELLGFIVHVRHGALVRSRLLVFDITGITTTGCFWTAAFGIVIVALNFLCSSVD